MAIPNTTTRLSCLCLIFLISLGTVGCHRSASGETTHDLYQRLFSVLGRRWDPAGAQTLVLGQSGPEEVEALTKTLPVGTDETVSGEDDTVFWESLHGDLRFVYRFDNENVLASMAALLTVSHQSSLPDELYQSLQDRYGPPDSVEPFVFTLEGEKIETDIQFSRWRRTDFEVTYRVPQDRHQDFKVIVLEFRAL